ncbi:MAG: hypothetical protein LBO00_09545 [Zoogloeaceae bacterium]|jgi:hypothetical protein|nr:hypothetical protein [Zoogloeaceae bacterium]
MTDVIDPEFVDNPLAAVMDIGKAEIAEFKLWSDKVREKLDAGEPPDTEAGPEIIHRLAGAMEARVAAAVSIGMAKAKADEAKAYRPDPA